MVSFSLSQYIFFAQSMFSGRQKILSQSNCRILRDFLFCSEILAQGKKIIVFLTKAQRREPCFNEKSQNFYLSICTAFRWLPTEVEDFTIFFLFRSFKKLYSVFEKSSRVLNILLIPTKSSLQSFFCSSILFRIC